jgi:hypothetical protein
MNHFRGAVPGSRLIGFCTALNARSIPDAVIEKAQWCLLNALGCWLFIWGRAAVGGDHGARTACRALAGI